MTITRTTLVILAVVGVLAGAVTWVNRNAATPVAERDGMLSFSPFVAKLTDGERYLRTTLQVVMSEEDAQKIEKEEMTYILLRSAILDVLEQQESAALVTIEGKAALKQVIAERVTLFSGRRVKTVVFSDYVVQFGG